MLEVRTIIVCRQCRSTWAHHADPACTAPTHVHVRWEVHRHRTPVVLPDGTVVVAVSYDDDDPYGRPDPAPDFGLYLDPRWGTPPWPHATVDWPDFGLPADVDAFTAALADLRHRAQEGERVELGCLGAHGRTGTALACLAVLSGHPADDAVDWVRRTYCSHAVETDEQAAYVAAFGDGLPPA